MRKIIATYALSQYTGVTSIQVPSSATLMGISNYSDWGPVLSYMHDESDPTVESIAVVAVFTGNAFEPFSGPGQTFIYLGNWKAPQAQTVIHYFAQRNVQRQVVQPNQDRP